jgi:gamma-glutamyl hercynylcysteine S-oxide synthase
VNQQARKAELHCSLDRTRSKTLRLLDQIPDEHLKIRVHDFYSPIGWHFGHIGMTEEYWTLARALGRPPYAPDYTFLFANIPENPKDNRVHLPGREEIRTYLGSTRDCVLRALAEADLETDDPLLADGYAWDFAHQHECQHQETIAELLQLLCQHTAQPADADFDAEAIFGVCTEAAAVAIPGGTFLMGSDDRHGYDNEKCAHPVTVASFHLDRRPVTAAEWAQFILDGGYCRPELWTPDGWRWRESENAEQPEYWFRCRDGYGYYGQFGIRAIAPQEPVTSISWYEADAYARWRGRRLPTETEWEYAASGNRKAFGIEDMTGSVWQWTSTPFLPYPGFVAFPYNGYSKDHMDGTHYVCRGGSQVTDPRILRRSFRNWYVPTYRQGFLGLRLADA